MAAAHLVVHVRARPTRSSGFVADVAFEVPPGITILFGPSGAGKTTLLAAIAGLLRPESGRIEIGGETWFHADTRVDVPPQRRKAGIVFQSLALFPHMTGTENAAYGLPRTLPPRDRRQQARMFLARMRVEHLADRYPGTFSGGEGQRVALARAIARGPRLLLLDEAFSAMDEPLRRDLQADVRAYVSEMQIPAIQITHQRDEALAIGDRVVVLAGGRVADQGPVDLLRRTIP